MLQLRPYRADDAATVLSWCTDEHSFYQWTAGRLGAYPLSPAQFQPASDSIAFIATDAGVPAGFFTLRPLENRPGELRLGFIIVAPQKRGHGCGKAMVQLAVRYAREFCGAQAVSLGVFENNPTAYNCYIAAGFRPDLSQPPESYRIQSEDWRCLRLISEMTDGTALLDRYWQAVLAQDAAAMRRFLAPQAVVRWHNTDEQFTAEEFIRANCTYPGDWDGTVQRTAPIPGGYVTVVHVFNRERTLSFHVTSFFRLNQGHITALDEYWGDDGTPPIWRQKLHLGTSIDKEESP